MKQVNKLTNSELDYLEHRVGQMAQASQIGQMMLDAIAEIRQWRDTFESSDEPKKCKVCRGEGARGQGEDWAWYCFACQGTGLLTK